MKPFNETIKVSTPENKITGGYAQDLLDLKNVDNAITKLNEDHKHMLYRLETMRDALSETVQSRKTASPLYENLRTGCYSVEGFRRVSDSGILRAYLSHLVDSMLATLNGSAASDDGFRTVPVDVRRVNTVIVDNAYGGNKTQYVQTVNKNMGIRYHPTLFCISVSSDATDEELSALVRIIQEMLDDTVSMFSLETVKTPGSFIKVRVVSDDLYVFLKLCGAADGIVSRSDYDRVRKVVNGDWVSVDQWASTNGSRMQSYNLIDADDSVIARNLV